MLFHLYAAIKAMINALQSSIRNDNDNDKCPSVINTRNNDDNRLSTFYSTICNDNDYDNAFFNG